MSVVFKQLSQKFGAKIAIYSGRGGYYGFIAADGRYKKKPIVLDLAGGPVTWHPSVEAAKQAAIAYAVAVRLEQS